MNAIYGDEMNMLSHLREHGEYLLPRRFVTGADPFYKMAEKLVANGFARWISAVSPRYPGIELVL